MAVSELEEPDEILPSAWKDVKWYVYGSKTYQDFYAIGVREKKVHAFLSAGNGFEYMGYHAGDKISEKDRELRSLCTDKNDDEIIHAVLLVDDANRINSFSEDFGGESKMNFHCANAFRVFHKKNILKWDDKAAKSARLHSEDMAKNNYFDHTGLNGSQPWDRMQAQGIKRGWAGENISAGRRLGFESYDGWVNSAGHRSNMLNENYEYLGVGIANQENSTYRYYHTQNFYAKSRYR